MSEVASSKPRPLSGPLKLAYGLGLAAEGLKANAFNMFLLFYYQQIVGLDAFLCGLAIFVSLLVDAFIDPMIGVWSDGLKSPLGRRHPFMYASTIPMAICFYLVFVPPMGMGTVLTFLWLLVTSTLVRFTMALYVIPHQSLVAELTADPNDRTSLQSMRVAFAWMFGLINMIVAYTVFFAATPEFPQGQRNPAAYPPLALFGAGVMLVAMFISAFGTQKAALASRPVSHGVAEIPVHQFLPELLRALRSSASYRAAAIGGLLFSIGYGVTESLNMYLNTFFWGFTAEELSVLLIVIFLAAMLVMLSARHLVRAYGNRNMAIASALLFSVLGLGIAAKLAGLLPADDSPYLLLIFSVIAFIVYVGAILGGTVTGTMIAAVTDENELANGSRQEGMLFSAQMFMNKAASGVGHLVAGLLVKVAGLPEGEASEIANATVDPGAVTTLGVFSATGTFVFVVLSILYFRLYELDGEAFTRIQMALSRRRQAKLDSEPAVAPAPEAPAEEQPQVA